jgi:hypothetical protein
MLAAFVMIAAAISSCKKEQGTTLPAPTASNIEIGTGNNKRGIIGQDFHLNADVVAGDKIDGVKVIISQKTTETYAADWHFELEWDIYKGARNTNVHKHFTIPAEAPKGNYLFTLLITDQNGTRLELSTDLTIIAASDLAISPVFTTRDIPADNQVFKKGETITARFAVEGVRDTGILAAILVKANSHHFPETVTAIDYSKAIVIGKFTNTTTPSWGMYSSITVGATQDYNTPASPITGDKAWTTGNYYFIMLYENKTHAISIFKSIPIKIDHE